MKTVRSARPEEAAEWAWAYLPQGRAELDAMAAEEARQLVAKLDLGHVYVVEFTSSVVKVGKSTNPGARVATHALLAQAHGGDVRSSWISRQHFYSGRSERTLVDYCTRVGALVTGREYFRVPFADVRTMASLLATNSLGPEDLDTPDLDAFNFLTSDRSPP